MEYEFSLGAFFTGMLIIIAGVLLLRFHAWVADNFMGGVSSYDRVKLASIIACAIGLLVLFNLHTLMLTALVRAIFPRL
jgi:hypothetical protein